MKVYAFDVPGWLESAACQAASREEAEKLILRFNQSACNIREADEVEVEEISGQGGFIN